MGQHEKKDVELNEASQNTPLHANDAQESKKKNKKWLVVILAVVCILVVSLLIFRSCAAKKPVTTTGASAEPSWAIYMYVCGSSLESDGAGHASENIESLLTGDLPDNLTVVMEVGGAKDWENPAFSADELGIWTITKKDGLKKIDSLPLSSMKEKATFSSFAKYCSDKYPADNTMMIIWDHGGGPYGGVCGDDNFEGDWLMVSEIAESLKETFGKKNTPTPLDIIDFDCCLMGSEEVACQLKDCAGIMIASEETEPGSGQNYEGFVSALSGNPSISPLEFAKTVVDNYEAKYSPEGEATDATLSAIDLSKMENVNEKMDAFAASLIKRLYSDPKSIVSIGIKTEDVDKFSSNSRLLGFSNLVDVKDFAKRAGGNSTEAQDLIQAVDDAVIHQFVGSYHADSGGLSMYYAITSQDDQYEAMLTEGTSVGFKAYHELNQHRELSNDSKEFIRSIGENPDVIPNLNLFSNVSKKEFYPLSINSEGKLYADFGPEIGSCSTNVLSTLRVRADDGRTYVLGTDDEIDYNWNEGIFVSRFEKKWFTVNNRFVCAELVYDSDEYNIYLIPFKLSEEDETKYYMKMLYDFRKDEWTDLGYVSDEYHHVTSRTNTLKEGQQIFILQYYFDENCNYHESIAFPANYSNDLIHYTYLPDGNYSLNIFVEDAHKDKVDSDYYDFAISNGEMVY